MAQAAGKVVCVLPNLTTHLGGVTPPAQLGSLIGTSVLISPLTAGLPSPSPSSGATYTYDPVTGGFTREAESLGPILTERAETIGKNKFSFGLAFQRFVFDNVDGNNIHDLKFGTALSTGLSAFNVSLSLSQYTLTGNYGVTKSTDVAIAIPFSTVTYGLAETFALNSTQQAFGSASKTASGIGDVTAQVKQRIYNGDRFKVAALLAIRTPTGDPYNALGSGAIGVRPFVAASYARKFFSPHVNLGYEWNGKSVLMGNIITGQRASIPKQLPYAVGFDSAIFPNLTLNFDVIGRALFNAPRIVALNFGGVRVNDFANGTYATTDGSFGLKLKIFGGLILEGNLLFRMNDNGLSSKIVPLVGISYTL